MRPHLINNYPFHRSRRCICNIQFFSFNEQYYRQIDELAMGSPLRSILANIFMGIIAENYYTLSITILAIPTIYGWFMFRGVSIAASLTREFQLQFRSWRLKITSIFKCAIDPSIRWTNSLKSPSRNNMHTSRALSQPGTREAWFARFSIAHGKGLLKNLYATI